MTQNLTDVMLLKRIKTGDERAFSEIYDRYWDRLLAMAYHRLGNLADAEECVHDVLLKLWKLRDRIELRFQLYTYLAAGIRYRVYDLLDLQHRKQLPLAPLDAAANDVPADYFTDWQVLERELLDQINKAIDQLPAKCQIVYRMSRIDGLSNSAIASRMGIAEKTVEAHLTKATKDIKNKLDTSIMIFAVWISLWS